MSWLDSAPKARTSFEAALGHAPELLADYRRFYGSLWDEKLLSPRLLELCRLCIAAIYQCRAETEVRHAASGVSDVERVALGMGEPPKTLSPLERSGLAVAEKVPHEIHAITDKEIARLTTELGEAGVVAFLVAATLFDSSCRMRLALEVEAQPASVEQPASANGPLY